MKAIITITLVSLALALNAQTGFDDSIRAFYGLNFSLINSGSGHGIYNTININVQKGRKTLEFGVMFSDNDTKISGINVRHRIFTGKMNEDYFMYRTIKPFFQYSFLYHITKMPVKLDIETYSFENVISVSVAEHYASYGAQIKITKRLFLETAVGIGLYMNSQPLKEPSTIGIHGKTKGITGVIRTSLGYSFN